MIFTKPNAEYNGTTKTAYISEPQGSWNIICSLKFFCKMVLLMQQLYGKLTYEPVGKDGVFVSFGEEL